MGFESGSNNGIVFQVELGEPISNVALAPLTPA
jgi:hypothetical protein